MTTFGKTGRSVAAVGTLFRRERDEAMLPRLREASPIPEVRSGLPPFLLLHGDADQAVPLERAARFLARLQEAGVPSELIVIPGAPHGIKTWSTFAPNYKARVVSWLEKTLGPVEAK